MARNQLSSVLIGGVAPFVHVCSIPGALAVAVGTMRLPIHRAITITNVRVTLGTAPTGASVIFDINKNGVTLFTTQANRPTIVASSTGTTTIPAITAVNINDSLTVDVDQIGSTVAGSDAVMVIEYY